MPGSLVPLFLRGRAEARPHRVPPLFGGRVEERRALIAYALPIATATKWVPWPDFTRIKTLRLPSL
jgi:hypothetical protein